jgi:hypothetical protein
MIDTDKEIPLPITCVAHGVNALKSLCREYK